jgi:hypothetical protein
VNAAVSVLGGKAAEGTPGTKPPQKTTCKPVPGRYASIRLIHDFGMLCRQMNEAALGHAEQGIGVALLRLTTFDLDGVGGDPGPSVRKPEKAETDLAGAVEGVLVVNSNELMRPVELFYDDGLIQTPKPILHHEPLDFSAT